MFNTSNSYLKKITFLLLIIVLLAPYILNAQATQEWVARYNPATIDTSFESVDCKTDALGNIYSAGIVIDASSAQRDIILIKYNSAGVFQWVRKYNGPSNGMDEVTAIAIDNSGNVIVTGISYTNGITLFDCLTIKYNPSGVLLWTARYNFLNSNDKGNNLITDSSGNIFVIGYGQKFTGFNGDFDFITLKYNPNGILQWASSFSTPDSSMDIGSEIALDNTGNVLASGFSRLGANNRKQNYLTIKYDPSGALQWSNIYNGPADSSDVPSGIGTDAAGNVYVGGTSRGLMTNFDIAVVKYNSPGIQQWVSRYNSLSNGYDGANCFFVDPAGNSYAGGGVAATTNNQDAAVVKFSSSGSLHWLASYNGPSNNYDQAYALKLDNIGNVYISGSTTLSNTSTDILTARFSSSGLLQWAKTYDNGLNEDDFSFCMSLDGFNNVFTSGYVMRSASGFYDIATIKYSQVVSIAPVSSEIPNSYSLSQNYPNPFNPVTSISFNIPVEEHVKLTIYDILGNEISVSVNESLAAGTYNVEFGSAELPSGVYFYKLSSGQFTDVKKMILVK